MADASYCSLPVEAVDVDSSVGSALWCVVAGSVVSAAAGCYDSVAVDEDSCTVGVDKDAVVVEFASGETALPEVGFVECGVSVCGAELGAFDSAVGSA